MKVRVKNNGFTLIELVLYTGLVAIMLLSISVFISLLFRVRTNNQAVFEVEQQGYQVSYLLNQAIRNSLAINWPPTAQSGNILWLNMASSSKDPTIYLSIEGSILTTEAFQGFIPLTNNLVMASNLIFYNISPTSTPGSVRFQFTLSHINPENISDYQYEKIFIGSASLRHP